MSNPLHWLVMLSRHLLGRTLPRARYGEKRQKRRTLMASRSTRRLRWPQHQTAPRCYREAVLIYSSNSP